MQVMIPALLYIGREHILTVSGGKLWYEKQSEK